MFHCFCTKFRKWVHYQWQLAGSDACSRNHCQVYCHSSALYCDLIDFAFKQCEHALCIEKSSCFLNSVQIQWGTLIIKKAKALIVLYSFLYLLNKNMFWKSTDLLPAPAPPNAPPPPSFVRPFSFLLYHLWHHYCAVSMTCTWIVGTVQV